MGSNSIYIIKNNLRFFKNHILLNLLKVFWAASGMLGAGYYVNNYRLSTDLNNSTICLAIAAIITIFTCVGFDLLQKATLRVRAREIFIRKWYGGKNRDIFIIVFAEHLLVVVFAALTSLLFADVVNNFFSASGIELTPSLYLCIFLTAIILTITGSFNVLKLSNTKISDLIIKIS